MVRSAPERPGCTGPTPLDRGAEAAVAMDAPGPDVLPLADFQPTRDSHARAEYVDVPEGDSVLGRTLQTRDAQPSCRPGGEGGCLNAGLGDADVRDVRIPALLRRNADPILRGVGRLPIDTHRVNLASRAEVHLPPLVVDEPRRPACAAAAVDRLGRLVPGAVCARGGRGSVQRLVDGARGEGRAEGRVGRRRRHAVGLRAAVRPRAEHPSAVQRLGRGRADGVRRAGDHRARERRRGAGAVEHQCQAARRGGEREVRRPRKESDARARCDAVAVRRRQHQLQLGGILMIRGGEGAACHAVEGLKGVFVAVRAGSVVEDQPPREPAGRDRLPAGVHRRAREADRRPDGPPETRGRRRDRRPRRSDRDRLRGGVRSSLPVTDPQPGGIDAAGRVGPGRFGGGGVVVGAVPVEVPRVCERIAVGIAGTRAVEADRERWCSAGRRRRHPGRRGGVGITGAVDVHVPERDAVRRRARHARDAHVTCAAGAECSDVYASLADGDIGCRREDCAVGRRTDPILGGVSVLPVDPHAVDLAHRAEIDLPPLVVGEVGGPARRDIGVYREARGVRARECARRRRGPVARLVLRRRRSCDVTDATDRPGVQVDVHNLATR